MKDPAGQAAPTSGFQNLGWYSGYEYYNGTWSPQAGQINPNSPQQGAGQMVSSEVNKQSDAAQGLKPGTIDSYVAQQNANPNNNPQAASQPQDMSIFSPGNPSGAGAGGSNGSGGNIAGAFTTNQPQLNLPDLYKSLSDQAGISDMEKELADKEAAYNKEMSITNNNPWLSESDRVGRNEKLTADYNNDIKPTQDKLAMAKQDIQTQLDLQTKQFDINSQQAQQALSEFNALLSSGALAGASGNDIAAITKSTGISSNMIQAAINAQKEKDTPTSLTTVDDGTNQYAVLINTKTGQVINKQLLGASKPVSSGSGKVDANGLTTTDYQNYLLNDIANKITLKSLVQHYSPYLPIDTIYTLYANNSPWGAPTESLSDVKAGKYKD